MSDCRDYKEILLGESLDSSDSSSDWEETSETLGSQTLGSQDTWSSSESSDSSQDSFLVSSENSQN